MKPSISDTMTKIIKKMTIALMVGFGLFFVGLFCVCISPLIAVISLFYQPSVNVSKFKKSWEDKIKELEDPDSKEKWKRDHEDLYKNGPEED